MFDVIREFRLQETREKEAQENKPYSVIQPVRQKIKLLTPRGIEESEVAHLVFDNLIAIVPRRDGDRAQITLTHVPTGYCMAMSRECEPKTALGIGYSMAQLLGVVTPLVNDKPNMRATDPAKAGKCRALKQTAKILNHVMKVWGNIELETMVGSFWRDRNDVADKLHKLGLPLAIAEQFAHANVLTPVKE